MECSRDEYEDDDDEGPRGRRPQGESADGNCRTYAQGSRVESQERRQHVTRGDGETQEGQESLQGRKRGRPPDAEGRQEDAKGFREGQRQIREGQHEDDEGRQGRQERVEGRVASKE